MVTLRAPDSCGMPRRSASSAGMTLIWLSVASAPQRTRSYSSCCSAAASTELICTASEPWIASSETCTALSAPMDRALRMASVAPSGPTVSTVTSPPCASLMVSASSMAYSSISLMTLSAEARATVLSDGSSLRSLPESGTCLTRTTMFTLMSAFPCFVGRGAERQGRFMAGRAGPVTAPRCACGSGALELVARAGDLHMARGAVIALDRTGAHEPDQVPHGPGLVVGSGRACPAEGLLAHRSPAGLVVDVVVAGGVPEDVVGLGECALIGAEDRTGDPVRGRLVDEPERLLPVGVVVDVGGENRSEELLGHERRVRVGDLQDGRLDEPPCGVVGGPPDQDEALCPRLSQRALVLGELPGVDNGAYVSVRFRRVADDEAPSEVDQPIPQRRPQAAGRVQTCGGSALLPLVLVGAPHARRRECVQVRRTVREHEPLAAGLADYSRIVAVSAHVRADRAPDVLEGARRAGEGDRGEVPVRQGHAADLRPVAVDEVDHAVGQSCLPHELEGEGGSERPALGGFPDDVVAEQRRGERQVVHRHEVEGGDGEDEPLQRPV